MKWKLPPDETLKGDEGTVYNVMELGTLRYHRFPRITMMVSYYNEEQFIQQCLEGIFEEASHIILIDGALEGFKGSNVSTDQSNDLILEAIQKLWDFKCDKCNPKITWIQPYTIWKTQMEKRNTCFTHAEEDGWIFIVDADERVTPKEWIRFWKEEILLNVDADGMRFLQSKVMDPILEEWKMQTRFVKNTDDLHYVKTHWTYHDKHGLVPMNLLIEANKYGMPEILHFTTLRYIDRRIKKVAFTKWRKETGIDSAGYSFEEIKHLKKPKMDDVEIELIEKILATFRPMKVLEWGAGISTLYYPKFVMDYCQWVSIEAQGNWFGALTALNERENVEIIFKPVETGEYINIVKRWFDNLWDVIFIDGEALTRGDCLNEAFDLIENYGIVICHDVMISAYWKRANWEQWKHTFDFNCVRDFRGLRFLSKKRNIEKYIGDLLDV